MKYRLIIDTLFDFLFPQNDMDREINGITTENLSTKLVLHRNIDEENTVALFDYRDPTIKHMIWSLKYKKNRRVAEMFTKVIHDYLFEELIDNALFSNFTNPILVPIPLSKKRLRERGFNQVAWVAKELEKLDSSFYTLATDILKRTKHTQSQTSIKNRQKRIENVKGVFGVTNKDVVAGKNIILLDDVITTGSTMKEARQTLLKAGARQVLSIAIAH